MNILKEINDVAALYDCLVNFDFDGLQRIDILVRSAKDETVDDGFGAHVSASYRDIIFAVVDLCKKINARMAEKDLEEEKDND